MENGATIRRSLVTNIATQEFYIFNNLVYNNAIYHYYYNSIETGCYGECIFFYLLYTEPQQTKQMYIAVYNYILV